MFSYEKNSKVLSGIQIPPFYHPDVNVGQVLLHYLQREPNKIVQSYYDDDVDLTAGEMVKLSLGIAKTLEREGFKFGDVIGLVVKNTTYVTPVVLGCLLLGCPVSTLDPDFDVIEVSNIFKQTHPKLVFCDHDNYEVVKSALKQCNNESVLVTIDEKLSGIRHVAEMLEVSKDQSEFIPRVFGVESSKVCAAIICSSGTSGLSKGVMISSSQCIKLAGTFSKMIKPTTLSFGSLYWLGGFAALLFSLGNVARRVVTKQKFSPRLMIDLVEKYKVNFVMTVPYQVALLVQAPELKMADLSSVRLWTASGGALPDSIRASLQNILPAGTFVFNYGMTEFGGICSTLPFQKPSNSVGKILPNAKLKIVDEHGNSLGPNEIGEVLLMSREKFLGYANNPEASRNAFDSEGWLKSGDLGYFTDEGEVFIVDRKKDMIRYRNYLFATSELVDCIQKMEGVESVCVVGVPDVVSGDLATALVVKEKNSTLSEQDVVDEIARKLADFKHLYGGAFFVEKLPMTHSGKVKKFLAKEMAIQLYQENHQDVKGENHVSRLRKQFDRVI